MLACQNFEKNYRQSKQREFDFFHELSHDLWDYIHEHDRENSIFSEFTPSLKEDSAFLEFLHHSLKKKRPEFENFLM